MNESRETTCIAARLSPGWRRELPAEWQIGWEPRAFALDGGTTEVVVLGSGPDLVLLPPSPGYKEAWIATAARLAPHFRITTFDLRVRFAGARTWDVLVADLERILDAVAPGPILMAGHSMGSALAQYWALARPGRVRGLVLSSPFARVHDPPSNRFARYIEQPLVITSQRLLPRRLALSLARGFAARGAWVYDGRCDDSCLGFIRYCMRDCPIEYVRSALSLLFAHDTRGRLGEIGCPTLVVVGEKESAFARPAAEEVHTLIRGSRISVSPAASHLHPLSNAAWLAETIAGWSRTLES